MIKLKENKGITLVSLIITVIILVILARVSLVLTTKFTSEIRADSYFTQMITIKAKAKVIAEEVNAQVWSLNTIEDKQNKRSELYESNYNMTKETLSDELKKHINSDLADQDYCFVITAETLKKRGFSDLSEENNYIVVYSPVDYTQLDIIYIPGVVYNRVRYYSLSELQIVMQEDEEESGASENTAKEGEATEANEASEGTN